MTGTPEDLAESPNFGTDAFSEVLDIVHVRGETAQVIMAQVPQSMSVPGDKPCVYIVERGELHIRVGSDPPVILREKQIALMLQGTAHEAAFRASRRPALRGRSAESETAEQDREPVNCFLGSFTIDGDLAAGILQSLPTVIVLDGLRENPIEWVDTVCELVLRERGATSPGARLMVSRLLDLLLVIILRRWAQTEESLPGWLAAARDERIARAVAAIHADPARDFSNSGLADLAGMSVSSFADRFKQVMGQQPGAYVRAWRLDRAAEALLHSNASVEVIADRVGYTSKEAFSRAFHAKYGASPSTWRALRQR
ncbi:MAG: AraC family transcriptional regulator [Pseudomonadota bacterium]